METYLRPDPGGALIPWLYALFLLLFHLPACIIRAVRWESAQYLALGLAVLGIALTIQSYEGTSLKAETVLVWMPLTLILDVGAMLQMVVLIIEKHGFRNLVQAFSNAVLKLGRKRRSRPPLAAAVQIDLDLPAHPEPNSTKGGNVAVSRDVEAIPQKPHDDVLRHTIVALFAFIFLLIMIILQIMALVFAVKGRNGPDKKVKWCSPAFRDFAVAVVVPGTCDIYPVTNSSSYGIGCIELPARQQADWLSGTIVCLSASLIVQAMDMALLRCAHGRRFRGVKMQRPWLTMFSGVLILIVLITFSVFNAGRLPPGISNIVWVFRKSAKETHGSVCRGTLNSPGLRGMIIGWTDGLFDSWGSVYHGSTLS